MMPFADMSFTADTDISFPVSTKIERDIIKELFFNKEYEILFNNMDFRDISTVLDLGCNVGFFTLFTEHYIRFHFGHANKLRFLMIDANRICVDMSLKNIRKNSMSNQCHIVEGLIGKRGTEKNFYISRQLGRSSSVDRHQVQKTISTKPVDLCGLAGELNFGKFDLIKVDLEGAESEFLEEYPDIISSARYMIVEWHSTCGLSWEAFAAKLEGLQFVHIKTSQQNEGSRTSLFQKVEAIAR
jgi:FkbM family methyltransferase